MEVKRRKMNTLEVPTLPVLSREILTKEDLADHFRTSTKSIDRRVDDGRLPKPDFYFGPQPRWKRAAIEAWQEIHKII